MNPTMFEPLLKFEMRLKFFKRGIGIQISYNPKLTKGGGGV